MIKTVFAGLVLSATATAALAEAPATLQPNASAIVDEVGASTASPAALALADTLVAEALRLVRSDADAEREACLAFVSGRYNVSLPSQVAFQKAKANCAVITDMPLVRLVEGAYESGGLEPASAMKLAVDDVEPAVVGKAAIVVFAYERYAQSLAPHPAMKVALKAAKTTQLTALPCLEARYALFASDNAPHVAVKLAFDACQEL